MRFLLDVNALIALGLSRHEFHSTTMAWANSLEPGNLLTCSITELGFVRVLSQATAYRYSVTEARSLLLRMKTNSKHPIQCIPDALDIERLPKWVKAPNQTTDGHLVELAKANGAELATHDKRIPGAFVIP